MSRLLLINWRAVDWSLLHPLLDEGTLPNLSGRIARGVMGTLTAPQPLVPPMLEASLAPGVRAFRHGILGEKEATSRRARKSPAFWDYLKGAGQRTHLINWPLADVTEETNGVNVGPEFFQLLRGGGQAAAEHVFQPPELAATLAPLRVEPREVDDATLRFFVPELDRVSREYDDQLQRLQRAIARAISMQAVASWLLANRRWDVAAVRFDLLVDLIPWALPLTAPKLDSVGQSEFDLYRHVLGTACRTLDLLLGPLISLAEPETTILIVSDHGLLLGDARPVHKPHDLLAAEAWCRREGMLVVSGPACRKDEVIFGAKLLDVVPTLLAVCGIAPVPASEGRVLTEAFVAPLSPVPFTLTWPSNLEPDSPSLEINDAQSEQIWNLARSHMDGGQIRAAAELFEKLHHTRPEKLPFLLALFECQLAMRKIGEARNTMEILLDRMWGTVQVTLLQARLEYAAHRFAESLRLLESIPTEERSAPGVNLQIGFNLIKLNQSASARDYYRRELEIQPDSAEAYAGLAYCCLRAGELEPSIDHATRAISLHYELFYAHFILALASARHGDRPRALIALNLVATLHPGLAPVHRCLAILYSHDPAQSDLAQRHKELAVSAPHRGWGF